MQTLTWLQTLAIIAAVTAGTVLTRFLPFWLFPENRQVPEVVAFLGRALPPAMMGLLVVYCLKGTRIAAPAFALPELAAFACIALLHKWRHNALLSIGGGTAVYIVLLRLLGA